jgi:topoisomerase-4 subunit A
MVGRNKAGKQFITVNKEAILPPALFTPTGHSLVASVSAGGRLLLSLLAEMKQLSGGGKGVIVMGLAEGDSLAAATVINQPELKITGMAGAREQQLKLSGESLQEYFGMRARGGKMLPSKLKPTRIE